MRHEQEVDERLKVDSTKGTSLINPVNYKGDVMVQVWMDSRVLATLCRWLESEGEIPRFLSHVVKIPLEMLADHLVDEKGIEMVDDTREARILLESRFHVQLNKGKRGKKNLMHNIVLSSKRGTDLGSRAGRGIDYRRPEEIEPEKLCQEEVRAKFYKDKAKQEAMERERTNVDVEKARNSGMVVSETREEEISRLVEVDRKLEEEKHDEGVSVKEGMTDEEYEAKTKGIKEHDRDRVKLEKSAVISEENIVKE